MQTAGPNMHCDYKAVAWIQRGQILLFTIMLQIMPTPSFRNKQQKAYKMCIHKECKKKKKDISCVPLQEQRISLFVSVM
jgi:hypothetical protein